MANMDAASPHYVSDESVGSLGEFFERVETEGGPILTADDHRAIVEGVGVDRDRRDD
jgi:hypothetical protein